MTFGAGGHPVNYVFIWFAFAGGTAVDSSLNGSAGDQITGAGLSSQLFVMINILSLAVATAMSTVIVVLLLTYLVTSADSVALIIATIAVVGDESPKARVHIITCSVSTKLSIGTTFFCPSDQSGRFLRLVSCTCLNIGAVSITPSRTALVPGAASLD